MPECEPEPITRDQLLGCYMITEQTAQLLRSADLPPVTCLIVAAMLIAGSTEPGHEDASLDYIRLLVKRIAPQLSPEWSGWL